MLILHSRNISYCYP